MQPRIMPTVRPQSLCSLIAAPTLSCKIDMAIIITASEINGINEPIGAWDIREGEVKMGTAIAVAPNINDNQPNRQNIFPALSYFFILLISHTPEPRSRPTASLPLSDDHLK